MSNKQKLEIELRGDRLFAISSHLGHKTELDVTSVWHFCKEAMEYLKEPQEATCENCIRFLSRENHCDIHSPKEKPPCKSDCQYQCYETNPTVHDCGCHGGQENLTQEQSGGLGYLQP